MPTMEPLDLLAARLTKCLSTLAAEIPSEASTGHTNIHKDAESIVRELINILFDYSLKLEGKVNSSGFDLCDRDGMRFVQVTSEQSTTKIQDCLRTVTDRVKADRSLQDFDLDILFLSTNSKKTQTLKKNVAEKLPYPDSDLSLFSFNPAESILDFNDLLRPLRENHVTLDQMAKLTELMDKYWPYIPAQPISADRVREVIEQYADNFTEPLFMHPGSNEVTLKNMYVAPDFSETDDHLPSHLPIADYLAEFLHADPTEQILVIEGDAAIGKTSLVSWMCHHAMAEDNVARQLFGNIPVVCVRLRELEFRDREESADPILRYLNIPDAREFSRRYPGAILILDGADELGMVSALGPSSIAQFVLNVRKALAVSKLIITSRPMFLKVSSLESRLFTTRRIELLHFNQDKRTLWLNKYLSLGQSVSQETRDYILSLQDQDADGVADTPLALYLLVQCRMKEQFRTNQWALYHEIFSEAIVQTYYNSAALGGASLLTRDEARLNYNMVKEIAYTMFRNSGSERFHITRQELDQCARAVGLDGANAERVKKTCVLCAYWKNSRDGALEFYHNNLRDFFLCEYICDHLWDLISQLPKDLQADDPRWEPLLLECCRILCWIKIDGTSWQRVFHFIALRMITEVGDTGTLMDRFLSDTGLCCLPSTMLESTIIWYTPHQLHPYLAVQNAVTNTIALWSIFMKTAHQCRSGFPGRFSYGGTLVSRHLLSDWPNIVSNDITIEAINGVCPLSYANLRHIYWSDMPFFESYAYNSMFESIEYAASDMYDVTFDRCTVLDSNFGYAAMRVCHFKNSTTEDSHFYHTTIDGGSFERSRFHSSNFTGVRMTEFEMYRTRFFDCPFHTGNLNHVRLFDTKFQRCDFHNCSLSDCIIRNTKFLECNVAHAHFKNCWFTEEIILSEASNLDTAVFENCTFTNVPPKTAELLRSLGLKETIDERNINHDSESNSV